jgi:hypothetical protein
MPNLHVTDRQVMLYMTSRSRQHTQEAAAASAGFSARTARRIDNDPRLPSQKKQPRTWRTRADPLTDIWPRVLEMLAIPGVMAVTIFEDLQDELGQDVLPDSVRRTLERRIAKWRAHHGADKEVFFPQRHDAGRQALSDFTVTDSLDVTIAGEPFPHRLSPFSVGLQRLGACAGDPRRRKFFRRRRRLAGCALEIGRRSARAPHRLAVGCFQKPRPRRGA